MVTKSDVHLGWFKLYTDHRDWYMSYYQQFNDPIQG